MQATFADGGPAAAEDLVALIHSPSARTVRLAARDGRVHAVSVRRAELAELLAETSTSVVEVERAIDRVTTGTSGLLDLRVSSFTEASGRGRVLVTATQPPAVVRGGDTLELAGVGDPSTIVGLVKDHRFFWAHSGGAVPAMTTAIHHGLLARGSKSVLYPLTDDDLHAFTGAFVVDHLGPRAVCTLRGRSVLPVEDDVHSLAEAFAALE